MNQDLNGIPVRVVQPHGGAKDRADDLAGCAPPQDSIDQGDHGIHRLHVDGGEGRVSRGLRSQTALAERSRDLKNSDTRPAVVAHHPMNTETLEDIRTRHRTREDFHRAEKRLTLQMKAICRRYCGGDKTKGTQVFKQIDRKFRGLTGNDTHDGGAPDSGEGQDPFDTPSRDALAGHLSPLWLGRQNLEESRKHEEKQLIALAKTLPVYEWVCGVRGFAALTLGQIIGESGDLEMYANPGKLWKRMGLAVIGGERQRKCADAKKAIEHGYSPRRRSIVWVLGDCLIKLNDGEYRQAYEDRKRYEIERDEEIRPIQAHLRAKRYMEKLLLKHLWQQWKRGGSK